MKIKIKGDRNWVARGEQPITTVFACWFAYWFAYWCTCWLLGDLSPRHRSIGHKLSNRVWHQSVPASLVPFRPEAGNTPTKISLRTHPTVVIPRVHLPSTPWLRMPRTKAPISYNQSVDRLNNVQAMTNIASGPIVTQGTASIWARQNKPSLSYRCQSCQSRGARVHGFLSGLNPVDACTAERKRGLRQFR